MKNKKKYKIELSEKQLFVYKEALEFYSRFISGQTNTFLYVLDSKSNINYEDKKKSCNQLKKVLFPELELNASYGIGWSETDIRQQESQISYEMYREVYVKFRKEKREREQKEIHIPPKKPDYNVYDSNTLHYSDQPLPIVKRIDEE